MKTLLAKIKLLNSDNPLFEIAGTGRTIKYRGNQAIIVFISAISEYEEFKV